MRTRLISVVSLLLHAAVAEAYRPFDSTDAAVVDRGVLELEIGPVGYLREGSADALIAPAIVANVGFAEGWEVVVQGRHEVALDDGSDVGPSAELVDTGAFLKALLRTGSLQGAAGPSVATEFGILVPTASEDTSVGATVVAIASQRWPRATVHLNVAPIVTRNAAFELFAGAILEGPYSWTVRPAAEVFVDNEFGGTLTISGLLGAIWRAQDDLSFDLGVRRASEDGDPITEVRAGFTWEFSFSEWGSG